MSDTGRIVDVDLAGAVVFGIIMAAFFLAAPVEKWLWVRCMEVAAVEQCGPSPFVTDQPASDVGDDV